jgi:hypothetical protein
MSDHKSRGSEGTSSRGEEQTPTSQDDAVNPSQRPESLKPEAKQGLTVVEHIEKPESAEEVEPNSHPPPKDTPEQASGSPDYGTGQGTSPEDRADGVGEEPAAIRDEVVAGPTVEKKTANSNGVESTHSADENPKLTARDNDGDNKHEEERQDETPTKDDTAASLFGQCDASAESDNGHASNSDGDEPDDNSSGDEKLEALELARLFEEIKDNIPKEEVNSGYMATAERIKAHFLSIGASVHAAKERGEDPETVVLDTIIVGNPGTGEPLCFIIAMRSPNCGVDG